MAQTSASTIRIRPFTLNDVGGRDRAGEPHLSIEIDGRILPLAKFIEIKGEIVASKATKPTEGR
ncbi:MAG: hypothetical protein AB8G16_02190 [Gammaproteobacteria bacterium]